MELKLKKEDVRLALVILKDVNNLSILQVQVDCRLILKVREEKDLDYLINSLLTETVWLNTTYQRASECFNIQTCGKIPQ